MATLTDIFLVLILLFSFVISIWNAYASGVTWTLLRNERGHRFAKAAAVAGLGLAFAGMAYAVLIVISYAALFLSVLSVGDFLYLVSFDFLVFGALIIGFGLVVTAQSVAIAVQERKLGSIAIAAWNVFAEVWDITIYAEGFRDASSVVGRERGRTSLYAIIAAALGVAFLITFVAFRHGSRRAEASLPADARAPVGAGGTLGPHRGLRITVVVAVAVIAVVVAVLLILAFVLPAPKVEVTTIFVWAPDNACGLNANPISYDGFTDSPGAIDAFALQIHNFNSSACMLLGVTTNTTGFGLSDVQVPVTVQPLGNGTLDLTMSLPTGSFNGLISLVYS